MKQKNICLIILGITLIFGFSLLLFAKSAFNNHKNPTSFFLINLHSKKTYGAWNDKCKLACECANGVNCGVASVNCCEPDACESKTIWGKVYSQECKKRILIADCTTED